MIRTASTTDADAIRGVMKSVPGFWDEAWRPDVLEQAVEAAGELAVVHVVTDIIDGFACAHDLGFRAYLSELVVLPSSQGKGVGRGLLQEIQNRLKVRGCSTIIADVWRDSLECYRSLGWNPPSAALVCKRIC